MKEETDLEVRVLWRPRTTGTPSRWQLRHGDVRVGRKPEANLGPEAHEPHEGWRRRRRQRDLATPIVVQQCGESSWGGFEGRSRALPWEIPGPVDEETHDETGQGSPVYQSPGRHGRPVLLAVVRRMRSTVRCRKRPGRPQGPGKSAEPIRGVTTAPKGRTVELDGTTTLEGEA